MLNRTRYSTSVHNSFYFERKHYWKADSNLHGTACKSACVRQITTTLFEIILANNTVSNLNCQHVCGMSNKTRGSTSMHNLFYWEKLYYGNAECSYTQNDMWFSVRAASFYIVFDIMLAKRSPRIETRVSRMGNHWNMHTRARVSTIACINIMRLW